MRIKSLRCSNIKTFDNFAMECGDVNVCAGRNAGGKSSALTLVTALFGTLGEKGDSRILHAGTDRGEISATVENDEKTETWEITRVFLPGKVETPKVVSSISGKIGSPAAWLKPLVDKISIDPLSRAMNAPVDEQTRILLDTLPMAIDQRELDTAADGVDVPGLKAHLQNACRLPSGLDAINNVHKAIYDHRRDVNRDAKAKTVNASELLATIPEGREGTDWRQRGEELQFLLDGERAAESAETLLLANAIAEANNKIDLDFGVDRKIIDDDIDPIIRAIDQDVDEQIRLLEKSRADRKARSETDRVERITDRTEIAAGQRRRLNEMKDREKESITIAHRAHIERISTELTEAKRNAEDQILHDRSRAIARKAEEEAAGLIAKSDAMSAALERLDNLRTAMLGRLDKEIRGLSLESGVIYIDGVPLDQLNTAERAKFWIKIGARRAGELGVLVVDGLECLDDNTFHAVAKSMANSGLQFFLGRVTNSPFSITSFNAGQEIPA